MVDLWKIGKVILFIFLITIIFISFIRMSNYEKANVKFCNEQGFGYSSGDSKDRTEIWCGVMTNDNGEYGFQGVTYPVKKKFFGGYKVQEGFDVNLELKKQRFEEYCDDKCKEDEFFGTGSNFDKLECSCMNLSSYEDYTIYPEYKDILDGGRE